MELLIIALCAIPAIMAEQAIARAFNL